ncbi:hypothetical protein H4F99_04895 [Lysobacter sp. SG-8]|uniref:Uncharacterized protein n=1 Tax=Marilutibacter penaei TaxID=2759900 RepID=A0A7W3YDI3_9GAMM|nr:hypothetical protein [Lysobacter penaei]MBB1087824.1 hypothetical protein [Lysobacter penaei]
MEKFSWKLIPLAQSEKLGPLVPDALPILLRWAKEGEHRSYSDLARELHDRNGHSIKHALNYGRVAGGVAQAIEWLSGQWAEAIPPLHVIVINKNMGIPGEGAVNIVPSYFEGKPMDTADQRKAHFEEAFQDVVTYPDWDRVARALGAPILPVSSGKKSEGDGPHAIPLPNVQQGGGLESATHKALKKWVAEHPEELADFGNFSVGKNEKLLSSGDRLDVHFDNGKQRLAVEVKTSTCAEDELQRGVYQCVKYRAIVRAEQKAMRYVPNGEAVLVCTRAPNAQTRALIKRLQVRFQQVPLEAEQE